LACRPVPARHDQIAQALSGCGVKVDPPLIARPDHDTRRRKTNMQADE
jgi:hypothetical protein